MKCMENWYWLSILIIQGRPDTLQHRAIGNTFDGWQVPELGVVTWGLPRWHVRKKTEVASNSARRVTSTLAIYTMNLPFQKVVWSRIWDGHFSNFGWWNWQLVKAATHRYVDESPNTPAFPKMHPLRPWFRQKKRGEFISSLRLGGSNFSSGVWDGWTKTWSLDHSRNLLFFQKEVTGKSKFVFQNNLQLDPCGVTVDPSSKLWFGWKSFFGIPGLILFSTWITWRHKTLHSPSGDSPCKVPLGIILSPFTMNRGRILHCDRWNPTSQIVWMIIFHGYLYNQQYQSLSVTITPFITFPNINF